MMDGRGISIPLDENRPTGGTAGVFILAMGDVSKIDIAKADLLCNLVESKKGFQGCCGSVRHPIVRMEPREMHGNLGSKLLLNPFAESCHLINSIIKLGDYQIGEFKMIPSSFASSQAFSTGARRALQIFR